MAFGVRETRFLLRTIGFARTIGLMRVFPALLHKTQTPDPRWAAEIAHVSGGPYHGTCLDRSVFLWLVLHQHGIEGNLRIGVARSGDGIDGHAWVEVDGSVLNDDPGVAERFAVFDEDPVGMVFQ